MIRRESSSSSSSCTSISSSDDIAPKPCMIKFLCSHGGKILPRYPDGKLRYVGGETRVLSVDRSISYSELQIKLGELCGWSKPRLRCQLPNEDLDTLVSVTSQEDLANLIEEFDLASLYKLGHLKIRAFLYPYASPSKSSESDGKCLSRKLIPIGLAPSKLSDRPGKVFQYLVHHGNHWQ